MTNSIRNIVSVVLVLGAIGLATLAMPKMATAAPIAQDLCDLSTSLGVLPCIPDSDDSFFTVTDLDGLDDDITSFILDINASYSNTFGIFDPFDTTNFMEIYDGTVAPGLGSGVVLSWNGTSYVIDGVGTTWTASNATYQSYFGLYITTPDDTYYSWAPYNAGGLDHLATYLTEGQGGATNGFDIVFAWEDLPALGDMDYNDLLVGCIDCGQVPGNFITQVPEPATAFLFGAGLVGAGLASRRRPRRSK